MEAAILPHACCPVICQPRPAALGAEERGSPLQGWSPSWPTLWNTLLFSEDTSDQERAVGLGPGLGHLLVSCDCRGRDTGACWWACPVSKAFKQEAAGEMEKEQAGLVLPTSLGALQRAVALRGSFLACTMSSVAPRLLGRCVIGAKCIMSFHRAKLASSLKVLPCPQHPGGLWCTPVTAVSSASRERFLPSADHVFSLSLGLICRQATLSWRVETGSQESAQKKSKNTTSPAVAVVPVVTQGKCDPRPRARSVLHHRPHQRSRPRQGQPGLQAELTSPWACGCFLCVSGPFLRSQAAASLPGLFGAILPVSVNPGGPRVEDPAPFSEGERGLGDWGPGTHLRAWDSD